MARKRPELATWDEMKGDKNLIPRKPHGLPTYDEVMFNRQVESRTARGQGDVWDVTMPNDIKDANEVELESVGSERAVAPTTNPKRPRALSIGYNPNTKTLIVVFRDNTWWQYNDVPVHMWIGLRDSGSTGEFLRTEGLDAWPDMGPADLDALSAGAKAQIAETAQMAGKVQKSKAFENSNLQSFTAEELFKDYL